jgi:hypothetical protein
VVSSDHFRQELISQLRRAAAQGATTIVITSDELCQIEVSPAVDAWVSGDMQKAQALSRPIDNGPAIDGSQAEDHHAADISLAPMPDEPKGEAAMVERAATTLGELGPEGQALVQEWGGHTSQDFQQNIAYAKEAFRDIVANRPDLIAKVDASGLGNDPAVLKLLAQHGRMQANMTGDFTVPRNGSSPSYAPVITRGGGGAKAALLAELSQLRKDNPPGTEKYKNPAVQKRIMQINETLYPGDIVGQGGRTG